MLPPDVTKSDLLRTCVFCRRHTTPAMTSHWGLVTEVRILIKKRPTMRIIKKDAPLHWLLE